MVIIPWYFYLRFFFSVYVQLLLIGKTDRELVFPVWRSPSHMTAFVFRSISERCIYTQQHSHLKKQQRRTEQVQGNTKPCLQNPAKSSQHALRSDRTRRLPWGRVLPSRRKRQSCPKGGWERQRWVREEEGGRRSNAEVGGASRLTNRSVAVTKFFSFPTVLAI